MQQGEPQAILSSTTAAAIFLTATVEAGAEQRARELIADLSGLRRSVGFRIPEAQLSCVLGIGAEVWDRLFGAPRPAGLHPFQELNGPRHTAPATPGDLLFHIRAQRLDLCFELAQLLAGRFHGCARIVDEVYGFRSFDERDLLGFVDGTENPEGDAARSAVQIVDGDPRFLGGSYVITQKYLHDLEAWNALTVEQQERAIGRAKLNDVEFPDEHKAPDSHLALNTIVDANGEQRQILRLNMPFGRVGVGEYGTYYIAYARDPVVIEEMLRNMFVGRPPANTDRILDFSTAVTGNLFFVPTVDFIDDPPATVATVATAALSGESADHGSEDQAVAPENGSLQIGSLKGRPR